MAAHPGSIRADDADEDGITTAAVIALVEQSAKAVEEDAEGTFARIKASEHPFVDKDIPALYVFVYDTDVMMMAHPNTGLVGRSYKGRPDVRGKRFRDAIVEGALANGTGWEDYAYQKPGATGIFDKTAYYMLVTGNDGKQYVVVSGRYKTR